MGDHWGAPQWQDADIFFVPHVFYVLYVLYVLYVARYVRPEKEAADFAEKFIHSNDAGLLAMRRVSAGAEDPAGLAPAANRIDGKLGRR